MFRTENTNEESNFWISYADLMAGLLFVFILLIGAIISKSFILKADLHTKEEKLTSTSFALKMEEERLAELRDTLAKSKALIGEKDYYLSENAQLIKLKNDQLTDQKRNLQEEQRKLQEEQRKLKSTRSLLNKNERMVKLHLDEIEKLNQMLLEANTRENLLSDKIVIVQNTLEETSAELTQKQKDLKKKNDELNKKVKSIEDYKGKVLILSDRLSSTEKNVEIKDEKLLTLLNAIDEKKTKYDALVEKLQGQKAKIKSLTGIKLKVVAALKAALGKNIDIDKNTGSLRLASNILFGSGEAVLKPEAQISLKKAFEEYIGTLVNDKQIRPHLDKIIIEGHTDSVGSYIYNLNLSQRRALAVMEYLVTLDFTKEHNITPLMTASGRGYIDLIKRNGVEDKEASRRIEIKFRLKNEAAMHEIEKVLDEN